jgi:hypothetical protein
MNVGGMMDEYVHLDWEWGRNQGLKLPIQVQLHIE